MIKRFGLTVGLCLAFFIFLEGLCSTLFVAFRLLSPQQRQLSAASVRYDQELGWVSAPNFYAKNYYAPGIYLRTNSHGFRANEEFTERVPPGKLRIICSGDSQTFGDGVDNDHTWCQLLESLDPRLQMVNMAESGYGIDQMYLRYKRDGSVLDCNVHVFAFVTDDFRRLQLTSLVGYGKPVLKLRNGELATDNVPVPRRSPIAHFLALKPNPLREFRSVAIVASVAEQVWRPPGSVIPNAPAGDQRQIIEKMIEDLQRIENQKNSLLVLAFLPRRSDYQPGSPSLAWRTWIGAESAKRSIPFIDLFDAFQKLPTTTRDGMFISSDSLQNFPEAPGHYDDQGHEYVAKQVYARLLSIPQVAEKLGRQTEVQVAKRSATSDLR
jgi:hypothetical protein